MPKVWTKHCEMRFLLMCFLYVLSDAARLISFPGSTFCLDGQIQIKKPKDVPQSTWQNLRVVDSLGLEVDDCQILPHGSLLTIPERCINHETGRRIAHISFNSSSENSTVYQISCASEQADSDYSEPVIECYSTYMRAIISRVLSGFDDEMISTPPPASTWKIIIHNGSPSKISVADAKSYGYDFTSDASTLVVRANYDATGIKSVDYQGQRFYSGTISLVHEKRNPKITLDVKLICAAGSSTCNTENMSIWLPPSVGILQSIYIGNVLVPLTASALKPHGITLDTSNGYQLNITLDKLEFVTLPNNKKVYRLQSATLMFLVDGISVPMALNLECVARNSKDPAKAKCTTDGTMEIEVFAVLTNPSLNLRTVAVRDGTCQPSDVTNSRIVFKFPLNACGTTKGYLDGRLFYENEVRALWKNLTPRNISRDSELRKTVRCYFNSSNLETVNGSVNTLPPPASSRKEGPLVIVINIYPDVAYQIPYSVNEYPIVKTLRDPIFLEVQALNHNDPNIELVLDDCWATMSEDPQALPQWNVVIDGCQESQDNYLTVFHPVDASVPYASYLKRFEVKAFAFMQGGELSTNLVYFHCSAILCNRNAPDSPLCTKTCLPSRKRRDELFLHRHSSLASPPGPVLLLESEASLKSEGVQEVIKQVTVGVLPAFAVVAVIILAAMLISFIRKLKC